jgi:hypothetical protein
MIFLLIKKNVFTFVHAHTQVILSSSQFHNMGLREFIKWLGVYEDINIFSKLFYRFQ